MSAEDLQRLSERANDLYQNGERAARTGHYLQARDCYVQSLELYQQIGDKKGIAWSRTEIADLARFVGFPDGRGLFAARAEIKNEILPLFEEIEDKRGIAFCLRSASSTENNERAREMLHECIRLSEEAGDTAGMAAALSRLGWLARQEGNRDEAAELHARAQTILEENKHNHGLANMKLRTGTQAYLDHDYDRANALYTEALALFREVGNYRGMAETLMLMDACYDRVQPSWERRVELLTQAAKASNAAGIRIWEVSCYTTLIEIAEEQGDTARVEALRVETAHLAEEIRAEEKERKEIAAEMETWEEEDE